MKKSCPVNSVTDCFFHKSCLLSFTDYKTRRDTPYNRLYEDTPPGRKGCFFHPRVMSKVSNLESEAYRKRAKEKRIFYTECFLYLALFLLDKKNDYYYTSVSGRKFTVLTLSMRQSWCFVEMHHESVLKKLSVLLLAITRLLSKLDQTSSNKTVPWCNSAKILPSLERMLKLN